MGRRSLRHLAVLLGLLSIVFLGLACNPPAGACENGIDDDRDGLADTEDPGCTSGSDTNELSTSDCDDAADDDGDGLTDFPDDVMPYVKAFAEGIAPLEGDSVLRTVEGEQRAWEVLQQVFTTFDVLICPTQGLLGFEAGEDYVSRMHWNLATLRKALGCS